MSSLYRKYKQTHQPEYFQRSHQTCKQNIWDCERENPLYYSMLVQIFWEVDAKMG